MFTVETTSNSVFLGVIYLEEVKLHTFKTSAQDRGVLSATHSNQCNLYHPGKGDEISYNNNGTTATS
jgi:hypothetical protein